MESIMASATTAPDPLGELLARRRDLWRGRESAGGAATLSSGHRDLDRLLPGGGWPCGRIVELVPERLGVGELRLLLPFLAEQTRRGQPVVLVAPPLIPCPQSLQAAGLDLAQLVVVRHRAHALWAAEQCLKSGLCGSVSIWPPERMQPRALRRLQLAAEQGPAPIFVHYRPGQSPPPSLATLRLAIRPGSELEILRATGRTGTGDCRIRLDTHQPPERTSAATASVPIPFPGR
jgi:protein ImuA